jgi:hypothetical protein
MPSFTPEILAAQFANGVFAEEISAGYSVQGTPRRAARGRNSEIFFTALDLQARTQLPASELQRLARLMAQAHFDTPGSVTAALRAAFMAANAEVLPFGQAPALTGSPAGSMVQLHAVCAVFRERDLYFGLTGNVLALLLRPTGIESYPAAGDTPSRALGTSLNIDLRYGHSVLSNNTTLLLAASPAPAWSSGVPAGLANLSPRAIGERLAQQSAARPGSHGVLIIRFSPAEVPAKSAPRLPKIFFLPRKKTEASAAQAADRKPSVPLARKGTGGEQPEAQATTKASAVPVPSAPIRRIQTQQEQPPDFQSAAEVHPREYGRQTRRPVPGVVQTTEGGGQSTTEGEVGAASRPYPASEQPRVTVSPALRTTRPKSAARGLSAKEAASAFGDSIKVTASSAANAVRSFLAGILPRGVLQENDRFTLPQSVLLGTAIAIPLLIVAVVAVMYFRKGYAMEFDRIMQEAQAEAFVADAQTDPLQARQAWQRVVDLLQTAARYGSSDELTTLQNHAARMLDNLDGITPLEFKAAVAGGLDSDTQITALLAGDRELYALDAIHERVLRLLLGQGGYRLDETFLCQSGEYPDIAVGPLMDMVWVPGLAVGTQSPSSTRSGAIVALDNHGILLYCPPGGNAMAGTLASPGGGWKTPSAIDYYNGRLYVLDPGSNTFWRFAMSDSGGFDQPPSEYFPADHPVLADVIDFVVASGEVFFLHNDGHITRCQYDPLLQPEGAESAGGTLCEGLLYNDTRPGRSAGASITDALFSRIYYNEPPEPTLFFLDQLGRGAYRFSLALNFISRYRVTIAPEGPKATALAIGADKVLYIAVGNQIYYAQTRTS